MLRRDHEARHRFRRSVAISHGAMFRDPEQFTLLEEVLLPRLLAGGKRISVWSAGCADGAELHTLALVLSRMGALERSVLLGSDLLEENLALARAGEYPEAVRQRLRWERRDLSADGPPPGRWRLILCRNVAIYLTPAARRAAVRDAGLRAGDARRPAAGPQRAADRPGGARPARGGPARVRAGRMRRRLTARTLAVSALLVAVVAVVLGGLAIGDRPPARRRASGRGARRR